MTSDLAHLPVRWSWLNQATPAHMRHAALHGKEPTPAMRLGTAGHAVSLDQPLAVWTGKQRRGKEWDVFVAECAATGVEPLSAADYDKARRMRDALRDNADASELLFGDGVIREQTILWSRNGRACSSRPDARKPGAWIVDLKCVRSAHPARFMSAAKWSGYPGQLAFYREADNFETGHTVGGADLYIVAVEPFAPFAVTVFRLESSARDFGARAVSKAWEMLAASEAANVWPSYSQAVVSFDVDDDALINVGELPDDDNDTDDNEGDL